MNKIDRIERLEENYEELDKKVAKFLNKLRSRGGRALAKGDVDERKLVGSNDEVIHREGSTVMGKIAKGGLVLGAGGALIGALGGVGALHLGAEGIGHIWDSGGWGKAGVIGGGAALLSVIGGKTEEMWNRKTSGRKRER